jgi:FAD/FMN-containing dehydrogenase
MHPWLGILGRSAAAGALAAYVIHKKRRDERRRVLSETRPLDECVREHDAKVRRIAGQLRARRARTPLSLRKRAVSHQVPKAGDLRYGDDKVDISDLNAILHIDPARRICVAESGVTFVDLVAATLRHGLVPIVVPELETITIGGAVSGCSIESTSYKYGGFHDTCLEYEVVTARGEVLTCTPGGDDGLVFQMMHGSFGTLGILSKLTFELMPAKRFVRLTNEKYARLADFMAAVDGHFRSRDVDFMDGIIHSPAEYVLCAGRFVDRAPYTSKYDWMKVYYRSTRERAEDYLTTPDYFFRYDRGVTNVRPKTALGRLLFGKIAGSANVLRFAEKIRRWLDAERPDMTLDVFVPFSRLEEFLAWYEDEFRFFPLWCVPYRRVRDYEWVAPRIYDGLEDDLFVDIAIYGMKQRPDGRNYHKLMEEKLAEIGGIKTLIGHNYYSEDDFWKSWNRDNYAAVKARTDPDNIFRDLYAKTCRAAMGVADGAGGGS